MYEKILVPLDGSITAQIVIPYAVEIAAKVGSEIILVSVSEFHSSDMDNLYRAYLERMRKEVQGQLKDFGFKRGAKVRSEALVGEAASEILRYADESDIDLIAMESRGSSGNGSWLLGKIAAKVLWTTNKPVLLIRALVSDEALGEKRLVKRIMVPLDGSSIGEAAIPYAEALARTLGAELVLFQAAQITIQTNEGHVLISQHEEIIKSSTLGYLDGVGKPLKERGLTTSSAVACGMEPSAEQIIDYAEANAIDIIAMSTHGRSGIGRWVFGSVTDKLLHAGETPILVVRGAKV